MNRFLLFLVCFSVSATLRAEESQAPVRTPVETADAFAAQFLDGEFEKAVQPFDATMTRVLPADKLRELRNGLEKQVGAFQERTKPRIVPVKEFQVVFIPCRFQKASLDMKVVVDRDGRITGLFFVPPASALEWKPPTYVDREKFSEQKIEIVTKPRADGGKTEREWRLPGFLTMPKGAGPFPGIVLVHGSGPNDADESIGSNKPFKDLAWGLSSRGVAVVRYVKRTRQFGKEFAATHPEYTVREETEDDAESAVRLLSRTPNVDPQRIYLLGHSLGGLLTPRIAVRIPELKGTVLLAANTRSLGSMIVDQLRHIFGADGTISPDEQKELDAAMKSATAAESRDLKPGDTVTILGTPVPGAYFLDLRAYDPVATAAGLRHRMLVLQGESDYQVTMADFTTWQKGLAARPETRFKSFAKLNHLFMRVEGKSTPENTLAPGHVDAAVVDEIVRWIGEGESR